MIIRTSSGETYSGRTYLEVVEDMRSKDFDGAPTARLYMEAAHARAQSLSGRTMNLPRTSDDSVLAEAFIKEAIRVGLAVEVLAQ